jgi:hypothetical protein
LRCWSNRALVEKHPAHDAVGCTEKSANFGHRLKNVATGNIAMSTEFKCVLLDLEQQEATSIPDDIRAAAAQLIGEGRVEVRGAVCLNANLEILHRQAASVGSMLAVVIAAIIEHSAGRMTHKRTHDAMRIGSAPSPC